MISLSLLGLDLLRLALLNNSGSKHFISDVDSGKAFLGELLAFAMYVHSSTIHTVEFWLFIMEHDKPHSQPTPFFYVEKNILT